MTAAVSFDSLEDAQVYSLEEIKAKAIQVRASLLKAAANDCSAFAAHVLRDEQNGKAIDLADMHLEWHELIDTHDRVLIWSHLEAGKTSQISVARTLFELGRDPSKRIVILSKTQGLAVKVIRSIASYIERSSELREVFPHLYPSVPWTQTQLMVQRDTVSKDYSVSACGVGGAVVGSRIDVLIVDDILDWSNTRTPAQRSELLRWFRSEFVGRLSDGGKIIVVGNAYHPEDFLHTLAREGYVARTYPVEVEIVDAKGVRRKVPRFPRKWSPRRIAAKRIELGPIEAARQLDCVARKDADVRCKEAWIKRCLERGAGFSLVHNLSDADLAATGGAVYTGVDIGVGKKNTNAKTVVFSFLVYPNGDRQILSVEGGRWGAPEIAAKVLDHHARYRSIVMVESNGAQKFILDIAHLEGVEQSIASVALAVLPFNTGGNKSHPVLGVESIFAELAAGMWIIPCDEVSPGRFVTSQEISFWLSDCENYDPNRHTGDYLMACWIGREGARTGATKAPEIGVRILGEGGAGGGKTDATTDPNRAAELEGWGPLLSRR